MVFGKIVLHGETIHVTNPHNVWNELYDDDDSNIQILKLWDTDIKSPFLCIGNRRS